MRKRQVVIVGKHQLWCESLEFLLSKIIDVELAGVWEYDETFMERLKQLAPEILVIADDDLLRENGACLTAEFFQALPDLVILHATPSSNELQIFTSRTIPASQPELIAAILNRQAHSQSTGSHKDPQEDVD